MNTSKKINVNSSSLIGLKAELLRKQAEIKDSKAKEVNQAKVPKPKARRKKIREKTPKVEPGYTEIEDVNTLKRSRVMLEAKTMLYDRLKKSGNSDGRNYLVDFEHKSDSSEDEIYRDEDYNDANSDPEDDWVEYEDCFGRTRKCLRRDLPKMREKDDMVKREIMSDSEPETRNESPPKPPIVIPEKEPEIEIMRKKWEEQMERLADKSDIHYQDVLFDEARTHGVGYYAFSQNEETRAKQQENLAKLRKQTEQRQKETQEVRDLKSKMELNRLRAATVRQRVRAGLPAELSEEDEAALRAQIKLRHSNETEDKDTNPEAIEAAKKATGRNSPVDNSLVVIEDKIKAFGELLGKRPKWHEMSQEEWVYKRRKDRLGEFAPVYENFRRSGTLRGRSEDRVRIREEDEKDPCRINASGPEPTDRWETDTPIYESEDIKEEKMEKSPDRSKDVVVNKEESGNEESEDSEEEEIGPLPPSGPTKPHTFINTFVSQPMSQTPQLPVSFDRSVPPPPIINFSVPPPSSASASMPFSNKPTVLPTEEDSSDSDGSSIIGPVPPPSISDFSSTQSCGPSLIDTGHLNMLSEIPLPAAVQFPLKQNCADTTRISAQFSQKSTAVSQSESTTAGNLDAIAAGLKFLREKFEKSHQ